jgi:hypothetical protein
MPSMPPKPRFGAFSDSQRPGSAPAARRTDVPEDVTLLDAKAPAPSSPAIPSRMPSGTGPARPAGIDPDTIPPISGRPLGSYPPKSGGGEST